MLNKKLLRILACLSGLVLAASCNKTNVEQGKLASTTLDYASRNIKLKTTERYDFNTYLYTINGNVKKFSPYIEKEKLLREQSNQICKILKEATPDKADRINEKIKVYLQFMESLRSEGLVCDTAQFSETLQTLNQDREQLKQYLTSHKETFINDFQVRIRAVEAFALASMNSCLTFEYQCQTPGPVVVTNGKHLSSHEVLTAKIYPAYINASFEPKVEVNGKTLKYKSGQAVYIKKGKHRKGVNTENGHVTFTDAKGQIYKYPFQVVYNVR